MVDTPPLQDAAGGRSPVLRLNEASKVHEKLHPDFLSADRRGDYGGDPAFDDLILAPHRPIRNQTREDV